MSTRELRTTAAAGLSAGPGPLAAEGQQVARIPSALSCPGRSFRRGAAWALLGGMTLLLALASPVATLARKDLFSAHMLQHLLLLLVAPAFLVRSWSAPGPPNRIQTRGASRARRIVQNPLLAWVAGISAMWLWHIPALCSAAGRSDAIQALQLASLLACGFLFWWPILGPRSQESLSPLQAIVYLVSACAACTVLGIYITFAPTQVCPTYGHTQTSAAARFVERNWGLTPDVDQQVGGLIMWVPGCVIYLTGVIALLARWYRAEPNLSLEPAGACSSVAPKPTVEPAARAETGPGAVTAKGGHGLDT